VETNISLKHAIEQIVKEKGKLDNLGNYYSASYLDSLHVIAQLVVASGNDAAKSNLYT